jgi:hypothetical protein
VDIKQKIRDKLRERYGEFETYLEHEYEKYITDNIYYAANEDREEWATYNQVILELKHTLKDMLKVKELQYKLTETLKPNIVCIELLSAIKNRSPELDRLYNKINSF